MSFLSRFGIVALIVAANVLYHLSQKSVPARSNVLATLAVAYAVALASSLLLFFFDGNKGEGLLSGFTWQGVALGFSILFIELGFLLAYRRGLPISSTALVVNVLLTFLLLPIGVLFLGERLQTQNFVGMVLAILGLILMSRIS